MALVADLDDLRAGSPQGVVVGIAMTALDNDLVGHAGRVRQPVDSIGIESRDAGRRPQQQPGGRTRRDVAGLSAGRRRNLAAGDLLQLVDREVAAGRVGHRGDDLGVHPLAPDPRGRPDRIDDRPQPQIPHDVHASSC
jgi:hypothetical protein